MVHEAFMVRGSSYNKLQNGIILLIFKMWKEESEIYDDIIRQVIDVTRCDDG